MSLDSSRRAASLTDLPLKILDRTAASDFRAGEHGAADAAEN